MYPTVLSRIWLLVLVGTLVASTKVAAQTEQHANAVYRATIEFLFFHELAAQLSDEPYEPPNELVVTDSTTLGLELDDFADRLSLILQYQFPAASADVVQAFVAANQGSTVPHLGEVQVPVRLITAQEMDALFGDVSESGWERFRERYPDAVGVTSVSRVGFDATYSQAMVYIGTQYGELSGAGQIFLLERTTTGWRILAHQTTWMS